MQRIVDESGEDYAYAADRFFVVDLPQSLEKHLGRPSRWTLDVRPSTKTTTIYCTRALRKFWPRPLAERWQEEYPNLFDADDLRLTNDQERNHFYEWFTAIHLVHARGALSLVEKYRRGAAHPVKKAKFERLLSLAQRQTLNDLCKSGAVQPPDLLVYAPDFQSFWFVEVKGPNDRLSDKQLQSHAAIVKRLKVPVEVIDVRMVNAMSDRDADRLRVTKKVRSAAR